MPTKPTTIQAQHTPPKQQKQTMRSDVPKNQIQQQNQMKTQQETQAHIPNQILLQLANTLQQLVQVLSA